LTSKCTHNLNDLYNSLPTQYEPERTSYNMPFGDRDEDRFAYDSKVGAARELYVRDEMRITCFSADTITGVRIAIPVGPSWI
jgi:hypothetical protein